MKQLREWYARGMPCALKEAHAQGTNHLVCSANSLTLSVSPLHKCGDRVDILKRLAKPHKPDHGQQEEL